MSNFDNFANGLGQEDTDAIEKFFEILDEMPEEVRDMTLSAMSKDIMERTGDGSKVQLLHKGYAMHVDIKNLNQQITGILSTMKAMLAGFDPDRGNGTRDAEENIRFFFKFMSICGFPMQNLMENMTSFKQTYGNGD